MMKMTTDQLREIADKVDVIAKSGIDVSVFRVAGHVISLKVDDDQRDGKTILITNIAEGGITRG